MYNFLTSRGEAEGKMKSKYPLIPTPFFYPESYASRLAEFSTGSSQPAKRAVSNIQGIMELSPCPQD